MVVNIMYAFYSECRKCGCKFIYDTNELIYNKDGVYVLCPWCKNKNIHESITTEVEVNKNA